MVRLVLFDIDGTLIHAGGAGVKAFAKTFTTELGAVDGVERLKFAGRTDMSLAREFFGLHQIEPTPADFECFFERYVFWLKLVEWSGGAPSLDQRLPMCLLALSSIVAKGRRVLLPFPPPPLIIPYGEFSPARVSPSRSLLSLLGPTFHCRGRTCTCENIKG